MWEYKDGEGLWQNYKNAVTGEETVKEHRLKVVWKSCKQGEHSYELSGNRELKCVKCGVFTEFVPGRDSKFLESAGVR